MFEEYGNELRRDSRETMKIRLFNDFDFFEYFAEKLFKYYDCLEADTSRPEARQAPFGRKRENL